MFHFIYLGFRHKMALYVFTLVNGDINQIIFKRIFLLVLVVYIWEMKYGKAKSNVHCKNSRKKV